MSILDVQPGQKVKIVDMSQVDRLMRQRLIDLDVMEETVICLKSRLAFGGPIAIESNGQSIGIRRKDASKIEVSA